MDETFLKRFKSDEPMERRQAVEELRESPESVAIPYLVVALMDENLGVQQAAIDNLIYIGSPDVVSSVIPLLRDELSAPLRNMAVEVLSRVGGEDVGSIALLLREENSDVRRFAADILGVIGDKRSLPALIDALKDENSNVRSSAANSLGMICDKKAIKPLIESLETEKEEWVVFSLIEALGKVGDEKIIEHLTPFLEGGSEPLMIAAVEAMKRFNVPIVAANLIDLLEKANEAVRGEVLKILVDMVAACPDCFPRKSMLNKLSGHLISVLADDDEEVKYAAVKGLGVLKEKRAVKTLIFVLRCLDTGVPEDEEKVGHIYDALRGISDEDELISGLMQNGAETPIPVIDILGELGSKRAVKHLIDVYNKGADREKKRAIVAALGRIGDVNSHDFLTEVLEWESGYVRKEAADALSKIGNRRAIPCLFMRLERERYDDVREAILLAIVRIGRLDVYNGLVSLLYNKSPEIREAGVMGLGMLSDERAIPKLITALNDEFPKVRRAAVKALSGFKKAWVEEAITFSLMDGSSDVKLEAVHALARIGSKESASALVPLLDDPDPWVRSQIVEALGEIGGKGTSSALVKILSDPDTLVKISAVRSLGRLKVKSAAGPLKKLLAESNEWELRDEAERALEMINA